MVRKRRHESGCVPKECALQCWGVIKFRFYPIRIWWRFYSYFSILGCMYGVESLWLFRIRLQCYHLLVFLLVCQLQMNAWLQLMIYFYQTALDSILYHYIIFRFVKYHFLIYRFSYSVKTSLYLVDLYLRLMHKKLWRYASSDIFIIQFLISISSNQALSVLFPKSTCIGLSSIIILIIIAITTSIIYHRTFFHF